MPSWYLVLEAAAEWGRPPWEIAEGSRIVWWMRWRYIRNEKAKAAAKRARESELRALSQGRR